MKKLFASLIMLAAMLPLFASAQEAAEKYMEGRDYHLLPIPVRTVNPDKIEVNEVFRYGCSHCMQFEPTLEPWAHALPADVVFERSPAIFDPAMEAQARAYYVLKQMNLVEKLHSVIFAAIHVQKQKLNTEDDFAKLFAANGVDEAAFRKAFNSFSVQSLTRQADARVRSYQVAGTPEMIVNGKYRVSTQDTGSQQGMLEVVDFLIAKERSEKKNGK